MTSYEKTISNSLDRQPIATLLTFVAIILCGVWIVLAPPTAHYQPSGILHHTATVPTISGITAGAINLLAIGISTLFLWMLNRWYNLTHSYSRIYVGLYIIGLAALPMLWSGISSGLIMCVVILFCGIMLYSLYQRPGGTRRIFLVFCFLSTGTLYDFAYLGYIIPLLLGCVQMRCMSIRAILAAGIGLITPLWIGWGFDLIDFAHLNYPVLSLPTPELIDIFSMPIQVLIAASVILTAVLTLVNTFTIYGQNAKTRANNGVLALLSLWTALAVVIDFAHTLSYLPILIALMSYQTALCFSLRREGRGYITILVSILLFISCAIWQIILL